MRISSVLRLTWALAVALLLTSSIHAVTTRTAAAVPVAAEPVSPAQPNVVELLVDDMRVTDLAYMPHLRRIAAGGVTMTNGFSPYPLCCPARASFFSGLLPHNHRVFDIAKPYAYPSFDDSATLATSLQRAGYLTGFTGKYLNGYGDGSRVAAHGGRVLRKTPAGWRLRKAHQARIRSGQKVPAGWDAWRGFVYGGRVPDPVTGRRPHGSPYSFFNVTRNLDGRIVAAPAGRYSSAVVADDVRAMVRRFDRRDRAPFFISANFVAPHTGSGGKAERARDRRAGITNDTTASPKGTHGRFDRVITKPDGIVNGSGLTETAGSLSDKPGSFGLRGWTRQDTRNELAATRQRAEAMWATDQQIGRIVRDLRRAGEWDNTVFLFWSDNGYLLGEHNWPDSKTMHYNPSFRVPVIFAGPGIRRGAASADPATTVDLTATILDYARARAPWGVTDGHSLRRTLERGDQGWQYAVPYEQAKRMPDSVPGDVAPGHDTAQARALPRIANANAFTRTRQRDGRFAQGVRTARYTYVRYANGFEELYDERTDPLEMNNIAGSATYQGVKRQLLAVADAIYGCRGAGCLYRLPPTLAATPAENQAATNALWSATYAAYGNAVQRAYWASTPQH